MNLGIVGTGRMGQTVICLAESKGYRIAACCNSALLPARCIADLKLCDVVVDFSLPQYAVENIELYVEHGIPAVIGTTGWYDEIEHIERLVRQNDASILYASNFSTGIAIFQQMLRAAHAFGLEYFESRIQETHHVNKIDAPSGTALDLASLIKVDPDGILSLRQGDIKGNHSVTFQGIGEQLKIVHDVQDRKVFADGALRAAKWLMGRRGFYRFEDVFSNDTEDTLSLSHIE